MTAEVEYCAVQCPNPHVCLKLLKVGDVSEAELVTVVIRVAQRCDV